MRRDIITILAITVVVIASTLLIGPQISRIQFGVSEPTKSIPIPISDDKRRPLADGSQHDVQANKDVSVVGTIVDADWGARIGGSVTLEYELGESTYSLPPKHVGSDGEIDVKLPSPAVPFRVVVYDRELGLDSGWTSDVVRSNDVDLGEVRIPVSQKPVLLRFSRHYGETIPDGFVNIWNLATDPPTLVAKEAEPIPPGRYLVRYTKVIPTWYQEVEFGKDGTTVRLPPQLDLEYSSIDVALIPAIEAFPITTHVRVEALEEYGFRREVRSGRTSSDGTVSFGLLPPGRYEVSADFAEVSGDDNSGETESKVVELGKSETQRVEFAAYTSGSVSAQVTKCGVPVQDRAVNLCRKAGGSKQAPRQMVRITDDNGMAYFGVLPWEQAEFRLENNWRESNPIPPTRGTTNHVLVELQPPGTGHLSGRLKAVGGVEMRGKLSLTLTHDETGESRTVEADDAHRFEMVGLPFGHYHLRAEWRLSSNWKEGRLRSLNWFFRVQRQEPLEPEFQVNYGTISGSVEPFLDRRMKPEYKAFVWIYSYQEKDVGWYMVRHQGGVLVEEDLAPGRYVVLVCRGWEPAAYTELVVEGGATVKASWKFFSNGETLPEDVPEAPR